MLTTLGEPSVLDLALMLYYISAPSAAECSGINLFLVSAGNGDQGGIWGWTPQPTAKLMTKRFKVGDHVSWNSEAGYVSGRIIKVHSKDVDYKGHTHHATQDEPQYEIKSDKTDHIALHKGSVLKKLSAR